MSQITSFWVRNEFSIITDLPQPIRIVTPLSNPKKLKLWQLPERCGNRA
ncbi:hypothetical protein [Brenneria roseae]|nr:hypothetical protein [Brenneria roseae]